MNYYVGKLITNFKEFYADINSATLTGAIDVIAVRQADNTLKCSPFHVRFGKLGVLRTREKVVDIEINGEPIDIPMELNENGEGSFVDLINLDSNQLEGLNLKPGPNEANFSVTTAYQGTTRCTCTIYLWNYDDKVVVSDIDGTITKSDVLGQLLPYVGKDWAQSGVAPLFTKISDNGYRFLYLSARAIGQSRITRDYLKSVKQEKHCLPDGPLLLSPTSLLNAFHREVIEKKPELFKIGCLENVRALFPTNPFFAGFGNKVNDVIAYQEVKIPTTKIFTINHDGIIRLELSNTYKSSYRNLGDLVDQMFPPLKSTSNEYSQFIYWRDPIHDLSLEDVSILKGNNNKD